MSNNDWVMHTLVFVALPCGGGHRKQGQTHAVHMVPFLAPVTRHHAPPICKEVIDV